MDRKCTFESPEKCLDASLTVFMLWECPATIWTVLFKDTGTPKRGYPPDSCAAYRVVASVWLLPSNKVTINKSFSHTLFPINLAVPPTSQSEASHIWRKGLIWKIQAKINKQDLRKNSQEAEGAESSVKYALNRNNTIILSEMRDMRPHEIVQNCFWKGIARKQ